ncbi:MAG: Rpn family recombination-promoting nuclease/putative transposase [Crocosphaera sp.]
MSFDNVCKYLAEKYPSNFVQWLLNIEPVNIRILKTELNVDPIRADSVLFLKMGDKILHLEFQTEPQSKPPLPLRMLDYSVRLKRKYRCSVIQFIIFLQKTESELVFTEKYEDDTTIHNYRVIRLWEQDPNLFINQPGLYPFAPLTNSKNPNTLLQQISAKINNLEDIEQRQILGSCTSILAGLRFDKILVNSLFQEDIMKGSVIYQDILEKGERKGEIKEGLKLVMLLLNQQFPNLEERLTNKIQTLSLNDLEDLAMSLLEFKDINDLDAWLGYPEL